MSVATRALLTGAVLGADVRIAYPPTDASWTRQGSILEPSLGWEETAVVEPEALIEDGVFRLWYRGGWGSPAIGYAENTGDPTDPGDWVKHGDPVYGKGGSSETDEMALPWVFRLDDTYHLSAVRHSSGVQVDMAFATSPDGIDWTTVSGSITKPGGTTLWGNRAVWYEDGGWKMLAEAGAAPWQIYYYTSSDGLTWSQVGGALTSLQVAGSGAYGGPTFAFAGRTMTPRFDGLYHLWYHAAPGSGNLPTNLHHATSPDLATWTKTGAVLTHTGTGEEVDQVADPRLVSAYGTSYLFFATGDNVAERGTIALATADSVV